jgi:hypothetical protein
MWRANYCRGLGPMRVFALLKNKKRKKKKMRMMMMMKSKKKKKKKKKKDLTGDTTESLESLGEDSRQFDRGSMCASSKYKCRLLPPHEPVR